MLEVVSGEQAVVQLTIHIDYVSEGDKCYLK